MAQRKHRSAKGVAVDFGLLKIKEQLANEPAPMDVVARQDHIDQRLRRRMRTIKKTAPPAQTPVTVAPTLPAAERPEEAEEMIDPPTVEETPKAPAKKSVTKQKARKATKKTT